MEKNKKRLDQFNLDEYASRYANNVVMRFRYMVGELGDDEDECREVMSMAQWDMFHDKIVEAFKDGYDKRGEMFQNVIDNVGEWEKKIIEEKMDGEYDYVTLETAMLLKKVGYSEPCETYYYVDVDDEGNIVKKKNEYKSNHNIGSDDNEYSRPLLDEVERWLEKEKGVSVLTGYDPMDGRHSYYVCKDMNSEYDVCTGESIKSYPYRQVALEIGIYRVLLELLTLEKKEISHD